jgi:hypothetical protein
MSKAGERTKGGHVWPVEQTQQLQDDWAAGKTIPDLMVRFGKTRNSIWRKLRYHGLIGPYSGPAPMFCPARDAIIREHYDSAMHTHDISALINAVPGVFAPPHRIRQRASVLGVKRPFLVVAPLVAIAVSSDPDDPGEPVAATYEEIAAWAETNGARFRDWSDLWELNKTREKLFLPWFKKYYPQPRFKVAA